MTLHHTSRARSALAALALTCFALLGIAGCSDDSTSPQRVPLTLQAQGTGGAVQGYAAAPALVSSLVSLAAADTHTIPVTFTRALLVLRDVRFEHGDGDDEGQIRYTGPYVVDLLAGEAQFLGTKLVPPGDYTKVMGHLQPLRAEDTPANDHPELIGSTILLEGDIAGEGGGHFLYLARIDTEFVIHGNFPVEEDTPVTSYLVFDLSELLLSHDGHFLDPRDPDNALAIEQAIRHATKIGMDRDHDGDPDDLAEVLD